MEDLTELVELDDIPAEAKSLWEQLIHEDPLPVHQLFSEVRAYQQTIASRSQWRDDEVDPVLARALIKACTRLLGSLNDNSPETTRRLVQAAVRYFVIEDDAESDLDSILGLDDDAEVMNAVLNKLGQTAWAVSLS